MEIWITFLFGMATLVLLGMYLWADNDRRKRIIGTILALVVTGGAVYFLTPPSERVKLGIDLQGGSSFVVQLQPRVGEDGTLVPVSEDDVNQANRIIQRRLTAEITPDIVTKPIGTDRIAIEVPGIGEKEREQARVLISKTAQLEFRVVARDQSESKPGWTALPYKEVEQQLAEEEATVKPTEETGRTLIVRSRPDMAGDLLTMAVATNDPLRGWTINMAFNAQGTEQFGKITSENVGQQFAIVVDGVVISAPFINDAITGGSCEISRPGGFKESVARSLATSLSNPLRNPVTVESASEVSATYGKNLIQQGLFSALAGVVMTLAFMLFYYRVPGLFAVFALVLNLIMLVGFMSLFGLTMTLPGIAGVVLTIGMSVDANVLIYERLREELQAGKDAVSAVKSAYAKAFSAIFDSNLTTLITCGLMLYLGSGAIKGFAIALTIGIVTSLFAALIITRVCFMWFVETGRMKNITTMNLFPNKGFDFLSKAKPALLFSLALTILCVATPLIKGLDKSLGIDFRGGALLDLNLKEGATLTSEDLKPVLDAVSYQETNAKGETVTRTITTWDAQQHTAGPGVNALSIRCEYDQGTKVKETLLAAFADRIDGEPKLDQVGAVFGKQLAVESLYAVIAGIIAIFLYLAFRFEFSFAVGTIVALFHDVTMAVGITLLMGYDLSIIHIGAILTVAGYSVNDTIVVFDRIRESLLASGYAKPRIKDVMNSAISQTMSRTILTTATTLVCVLVMFLFGGPTLKDFSFPLLVGVITGAYSTIFIAAPIALWWSRRKGRDLESEIHAREEALRSQEAEV